MEPDFFEIVDWMGDRIHREFYSVENFDSISSDLAYQSQAVCFVDEKTVVLFKDSNGHIGMPGGHIEKGETYEKTLAREIFEESTCELVECGPTCFIKEWEESTPESVRYALRYWAIVKPLNETVNDPCSPGRKRVIIDFDKAADYLGWGKSADFLLILASEKINFSLKYSKSN